MLLRRLQLAAQAGLLGVEGARALQRLPQRGGLGLQRPAVLQRRLQLSVERQHPLLRGVHRVQLGVERAVVLQRGLQLASQRGHLREGVTGRGGLHLQADGGVLELAHLGLGARGDVAVCPGFGLGALELEGQRFNLRLERLARAALFFGGAELHQQVVSLGGQRALRLAQLRQHLLVGLEGAAQLRQLGVAGVAFELEGLVLGDQPLDGAQGVGVDHRELHAEAAGRAVFMRLLAHHRAAHLRHRLVGDTELHLHLGAHGQRLSAAHEDAAGREVSQVAGLKRLVGGHAHFDA